ncbi:response regulator [Pseudomonas sp. 14P_8.1_Bac3]|uniref:response regulator transcription factor n=1 Tax=Pseudomonas sp. 14P_8.1_Bac3 TaxID=2971621 RepID=UPI0021CA9F04|nr:response regulator [Pseudomonas sp. 14P_8.1_Bac3]MCU1758793.1 response regulator [Pseudomonas sp. 14P_8.1_Bac3]
MVTRQAIAIIDDDDNVRSSLDSLLRSYGYSVHLYDSAETFLTSGRVISTACIVSDIQMPGVNGLQMYQHLLAQGHVIPVIFITASADDAPRVAASKLGACCYLSKPFDGQSLINCLDIALKSNNKAH